MIEQEGSKQVGKKVVAKVSNCRKSLACNALVRGSCTRARFIADRKLVHEAAVVVEMMV